MVRARARRICWRNHKATNATDTAAKMRGGQAARTFFPRWCAPARGGSVGEITRRQTQPILLRKCGADRRPALSSHDGARPRAADLLAKSQGDKRNRYSVLWLSLSG